MELMSESDPGGLCQGWVQPGYLTDTHYFSVIELGRVSRRSAQQPQNQA